MNTSAQIGPALATPQTAGVGRRLVAFTIDVLPFAVLVWGASAMFSMPGHQLATQPLASTEPAHVAAWLVVRQARRISAFALYLVYAAACEGSVHHATPGKRALGIVVEGARGAPVQLRQAALRNAAKILSYVPFGLGFLWALSSRERRAWHDSLSGTRVVRTRQTAA